MAVRVDQQPDLGHRRHAHRAAHRSHSEIPVSGTTSHCLDVPGGQVSTPGLPMQIWGCNGTIAQNWLLS
jgi:hypothetical protein